MRRNVNGTLRTTSVVEASTSPLQIRDDQTRKVVIRLANIRARTNEPPLDWDDPGDLAVLKLQAIELAEALGLNLKLKDLEATS